MIRLFYKSLLLIASTAVLMIVQTSNVTAQITIQSPDDIPLETTPDGGQAYYEAATGNVYWSLGTDLLIAAIAFVDDQLMFENLTIGLPITGAPLTQDNLDSLLASDQFGFIALPNPFNPPGGLTGGTSVIANLGPILPADPSITDVASFQASPFGDAQFQFSTGPTEGFRDFNVIAATIPEPGSFSILALAGLSCIARRRRS